MLTLRDVGRHPQGASALQRLRNTYTISQGDSGLILTQSDTGFRLFLYDMDEVLLAARRAQDAAGGPSARRPGEPNDRQGASSSCADDLRTARETIAKLEARIVRLQTLGKAVTEERDQWKRRATKAEEHLGDSRRADSGAGDARYGTLRRFLAKQFHPDHAPGSGIEKMIRSEMFKEIWAEVERVDAKHR